MKKRILALTFVFVLLIMTGCDREDISDPLAVWERFSAALEQTEQLTYYEITENRTVDGNTTSTHLVLTNDEMGRTVAYKSTDAGELWWFQGLTYDNTDGEKSKYAQGINTFLGISDHQQGWEYSSVSDVEMNKGIITFSIVAEDCESCSVSARVGKVYIEQITVEILRQGRETPEIIEYVYKDPGQKPSVTLPGDLNDYHY